MSRPTIGRGSALLKALQDKKKAQLEAEAKNSLTVRLAARLAAEATISEGASTSQEVPTSEGATTSQGVSTSEGATTHPTSEAASTAAPTVETAPSSGAETAPQSGPEPKTTPPKAPSASAASPPKSPTDPSEPKRRETVIRKGSAGMPIDLAANFVRISHQEGGALHEYTVTMEPGVDDLK